ncbi:bifunctional 23S rRNA (guanine(2069)-N(7))-methyltransferase RlmK/23S rRNA (guanine(2445)-N(2))-methyltransferase RlmL [Adlercreutzia sp. ZJ138]|uniref:bifunctional 23S rRNA (guanine(2069)-N(7))-methyltransferase RlmK/23S rRNA (guanine(2445)-N(2))-methyltransferase RlmL n=1 Tax=Adlercreutzia sp. ZJ138 TaxID=2709405 RepID=UPI0013EC2A50|nr:bifunctional 23S rRNA (guanine(2069)-N(7))-methyltransferase RlmK/23S rRNA (guanine(2445)-N(2))-methyltransferase RlmL [Adlercreutzia sp. ZJ138]
MNDNEYELFASCLSGLEQLLADELCALGAWRVRPLGGGVAFFGGVSEVHRACLWSRLASRITLVVGRFHANNADELYRAAVELPWQDIIARDATIAVRAYGFNDELRDTQFTALKVKDAICDELRLVRGFRPDVDAAHPDARVEVRIRERKVTLSLDLSGASLYVRPYLFDDDPNDSSLICAQAAGLLAMLGWGSSACERAALVDPVCGNGELLAEAAAVATDMAPNLARRTWGFFGWTHHDADLWKACRQDAMDRFDAGLLRMGATGGEHVRDREAFDALRIGGFCDSSPRIARARRRLRKAGLSGVASVVVNAQSLPSLCQGDVRSHDSLDRVFVATVLPTGVDQADARRYAEASAFASACMTLAAAVKDSDLQASARDAEVEADAKGEAGSVPSSCSFGAVSAQAVRDRFGVQPCATASFGQGRVRADAVVFDRPPANLVTVVIPDSAGGAEHRVEVLEQNSEQFAARLRKSFKERKKWARREGASCYRVYDADLPDYACAIDVYEGELSAEGRKYVHVAEYAAPSSIDESKANRRFADVLTLVPVVMGVRPDRVFSKVRKRDKGGGQYRDAGRKNYVTHVGESGFLFEVDLAGYLDTGLFLDHRLTRERIGSMAKGARFLNLFAYTGSATVHAAGGGACETTTVDLSQTYLDWARRNMDLNGFTGPEHEYVREDAVAWVTEARRRGRRFDLIFVDPPTFSNSKAMGRRTWDVQRDHAELLIGVSRLLSEEGTAVFSCNLRSFKPDVEKLTHYGVSIEDISAHTIPEDFSRSPRIHKCYLVRRVQE